MFRSCTRKKDALETQIIESKRSEIGYEMPTSTELIVTMQVSG